MKWLKFLLCPNSISNYFGYNVLHVEPISDCFYMHMERIWTDSHNDYKDFENGADACKGLWSREIDFYYELLRRSQCGAFFRTKSINNVNFSSVVRQILDSGRNTRIARHPEDTQHSTRGRGHTDFRCSPRVTRRACFWRSIFR